MLQLHEQIFASSIPRPFPSTPRGYSSVLNAYFMPKVRIAAYVISSDGNTEERKTIVFPRQPSDEALSLVICLLTSC